MADVTFTFNLDIDPWQGLGDEVQDGLVTRVGLMPDGTEKGHPVVVILTELDSGDQIVSQITWNQFKQVYEAAVDSPVVALDNLKEL